MFAHELIGIRLGDEPSDYFAKEAAAGYRGEAIRIAGVFPGCAGVWMKVNPNLVMKMLTRVEMCGFEIRAQRIDQRLVDRLNLLKKQMPIAILDRAMGIKPCLKGGGRGRFSMHVYSLADHHDLCSARIGTGASRLTGAMQKRR